MKIILKDMMERRGLNQRELSERSGVPQPIISTIVTGVTPSPTIGTMYKLARALRCLVDDLITDDDAA
jgi:transcriptional regulator with XRE-family HTH domain